MDPQSWATIAVFVATQVITLVAVVATTKADARSIHRELTELKEVAKSVSEVLRIVAVQGSRLDRCEDDIRELKHGEGYVLPLTRALGAKPVKPE